jgi:hypothetical protein
MNAKMLLESTCISIDIQNKSIEYIHNNKNNIVNGNKIIIAVPITNLNNIDIKPELKWPKTEQPKSFKLCRIYAKYLDVWFKDMPKMITDTKLGMIIPINYENGLIMISYTDNIKAEYWNTFDSHNDIKKEITRELKLIFPHINISNPEWISFEYWNEGCHYWGKNKDDSLIMKKVQDKLGEDVYLINESYCHHQCWIEGSLKMVNKILKIDKDGNFFIIKAKIKHARCHSPRPKYEEYASQIPALRLDNSYYQQKYLKYKNKYLQLKQILNTP